jgi:hypothetical protein
LGVAEIDVSLTIDAEQFFLFNQRLHAVREIALVMLLGGGSDLLRHNVIKVNRTLRTTPPIAAGVTDRLWEVADLVAALEANEQTVKRAAR